jgi:hypothetical protein
MFLDLSQEMKVKADEKAKNTTGSGSSSSNLGMSNGRGGITVVDDSQIPQRQKSGCCGGGGSSTVIEGLPDPNSVHSQ